MLDNPDLKEVRRDERLKNEISLELYRKMVINSKPLLCNFIVLSLSKFCNSYKGNDRSELILDMFVSIIP